MKIHLHDYKENIIYTALWLILLFAPIISMYIHTNNNAGFTFSWIDIFHVWRIYAIFLVAFLIHNFILAPLLVYKHKKTLYFTTTGCLIVVFIIFQCTQKPKEFRDIGHMPQEQRMMDNHKPLLDDNGNPANVDGKGIGHGQQMQPRPDHNPNDRGMDGKGFRGRRHRDGLPPLMFGQVDVINVITLIMLIGMNLGIKLYFKSDNDAKEMQQLEKQNLQQQLEYLKYQINPHFFMNTLNNIHALVDIDPEKAKTTIVELSKMMRYILYEGNKTLIPIQREIQFLNNYITLMRLRYTDKVKIKIDIPEEIPDDGVPPLMLITFVENAFKHGVSYKQESFINVEMRFIGDRFYFGCKNSKHPESTAEHGGVGLTNVRKRLDLIYGDNFSLDINESPDTYEVKLDIPLNTSTDPSQGAESTSDKDGKNKGLGIMNCEL